MKITLDISEDYMFKLAELMNKNGFLDPNLFVKALIFKAYHEEILPKRNRNEQERISGARGL